MPRSARIVIPGLPYHITQRGNNRQMIFRDDDDLRLYLALLGKYALLHKLSILGYCLMDNHIHAIALPREQDSLAKGIGQAHAKYAQLFNERHEQTGHLLQGRFYSCPLDGAHFVTAMRYIERNPVRAGLVEWAWEYPWSSAKAHVGLCEHHDLLDLEDWRGRWTADAWREQLLIAEDEQSLRQIRVRTISGRPLGDRLFNQKIQKILGENG